MNDYFNLSIQIEGLKHSYNDYVSICKEDEKLSFKQYCLNEIENNDCFSHYTDSQIDQICEEVGISSFIKIENGNTEYYDKDDFKKLNDNYLSFNNNNVTVYSQEEIENKVKEEFELDKDIDSFNEKFTEAFEEYREDNQLEFVQDGYVYTYWDGHNWQSIVIDEDFDDNYEIVRLIQVELTKEEEERKERFFKKWGVAYRAYEDSNKNRIVLLKTCAEGDVAYSIEEECTNVY